MLGNESKGPYRAEPAAQKPETFSAWNVQCLRLCPLLGQPGPVISHLRKGDFLESPIDNVSPGGFSNILSSTCGGFIPRRSGWLSRGPCCHPEGHQQADRVHTRCTVLVMGISITGTLKHPAYHQTPCPRGRDQALCFATFCSHQGQACPGLRGAPKICLLKGFGPFL